MPNCSNKFSFRIFADDTKLFYASDDPNDLSATVNSELDKLFEYCRVNKLTVNLKKTNYMLISSRQKKWQISVHNLEQKDYIKYLGIYLDKNLTWEPQINHIRSKLSKNIGIIY